MLTKCVRLIRQASNRLFGATGGPNPATQAIALSDGVRRRQIASVPVALGAEWNDARALRAGRDTAALAALLSPVAGREADAVATTLLSRWRTLGRVLSAEPAQLHATVENGVAELIVSARAAMLQALSEELLDRPLLNNWQDLNRYLAAAMAHAPVEQVRMLLLDLRNHLLADELVASGTIDEAPLRAREVARRCIDLGATGVIIAHNHPSGDPHPSGSDISATRRLEATLRDLHIRLHDHVIVAEKGIISMRSLGLL